MILVNELALNMKLALEFHYRKKKKLYIRILIWNIKRRCRKEKRKL